MAGPGFCASPAQIPVYPPWPRLFSKAESLRGEVLAESSGLIVDKCFFHFEPKAVENRNENSVTLMEGRAKRCCCWSGRW